jgi:hypothetical protein
LIAKYLVFDFVNYYGILIWIGIIKVWVQKDQTKVFGTLEFSEYCLYENCMLELTMQMTIIFVGKSIIYHFQNALEPLLTGLKNAFKTNQIVAYLRHLKYFHFEEDETLPTESKHWKSQLHADKNLTNAEAQNTEISGYNTATVQFGFIVLFSVAFPLAPFFGCLHNIVQRKIGTLIDSPYV